MSLSKAVKKKTDFKKIKPPVPPHTNWQKSPWENKPIGGRVNVAVVGAGAVGKEMVRILLQRNFPMKELRVLARSARTIELDNKKYEVQETKPESFDNIHIALFAGTEGEKGAAAQFAKEAIARGAVVIDNGSDFRMDPKVPLVIPEINKEDLAWHQGIIANPNCTACLMLMAVAPLHKKFRVKKIVVSTYQAVSGAGGKAVEELRNQTQEFLSSGKVQDSGSFPDPIAFNVLSHNWKIERDGYSNEELKVIAETRKILHDKKIQVVPTTVRVPVFNAHSESIYLELEEKISPKQAEETLKKSPGVLLVDSPMPTAASGKDEVLVGRIRKDLFNPKALLLWVCGDNLRKGAALNAVQIAESLIS